MLISNLFKFLKSSSNDQSLQEIAVSRGYSYQSEITHDNSESPLLMALTKSKNSAVKNMISGILSGMTFNVFTVPNANHDNKLEITICEVGHPYDIPSLLLLIKNFLPVDYFGEWKKLSLEGDFDKYYGLYVSKDNEIQALEIFTPDMMQDLISNGKGFNVEFENRKFYIFSFSLLTIKKAADLDAFLAFSKFVNDKLILNLKNRIGSTS